MQAVQLLPCFETGDVERTRRLSRWSDQRTIEIYPQELAAVSVIPSLPAWSRQRIQQLSELAPQALQYATHLLTSAVPPSAWTTLFRSF